MTLEEQFRLLGLPFPIPPPDFPPITKADIVRKTGVHPVHTGPPIHRAILRSMMGHDDDLTDEERVAEAEAHEAATKEWQRTGGVYFIQGATPPPECTIFAANGSKAFGYCDGKEWHWQSWEIKSGR